MEFKFISNKPWVDETIRLRKALCFTTLAMAILGIILIILGIVLLAYMEFVVGVISIIFGVLIPVGYFGANVLLFVRRRKTYSKNAVIEYHFTEDALEIIKLSDNYKTKSVISYNSFTVSKVYNKSRFVVLKTKNSYSDIVVIRKKDIVLEDGKLLNQEIVSFVSFLMAKVAEANRAEEVTCEAEKEQNPEISGQNNTDNVENVENNVVENDENNDNANAVKFDDLTEKDEVNDIDDERGDVEPTAEVVEYDIVEEDVKLDDENIVDNTDDLEQAKAEPTTDKGDAVEEDVALDEEPEPVDAEPTTDDEDAVEEDVALDEETEPVDAEPTTDKGDAVEEDAPRDESLFDYGETIVKNEDLVSNEPKQGFFMDYESDDDEKKD